MGYSLVHAPHCSVQIFRSINFPFIVLVCSSVSAVCHLLLHSNPVNTLKRVINASIVTSERGMYTVIERTDTTCSADKLTLKKFNAL